MNDTLSNMLRKLRLSGLAETLEVRLHEASGNSLTHAEFLELVLQDEMLIRQQRPFAVASRTGRRLATAKGRFCRPKHGKMGHCVLGEPGH